MSSKTNYLENKLIDARWRAQPFVVGNVQLQWVLTAGAPSVSPPTHYLGLLSVSLWVAQSVVVAGSFIIRPDSAGVAHLLKCTTGGTTGVTAPTASLTKNAAVNDGSVVWTDQYDALEAGVAANLPAELSGGSYARQPVISGLAAMAGTQGAGSTVASSGNSGTTSNNSPIVFNSGNGGNIGLFAWFDALTIGNMLEYGFITNGPITVSANATITFPSGSVTDQEDN
jgi:hypothetical protein